MSCDKVGGDVIYDKVADEVIFGSENMSFALRALFLWFLCFTVVAVAILK